jgi:tetratricopeptide (TPR) repeat protein
MKTLFRRNIADNRKRALGILDKLENQFPQDIELMSIRVLQLLTETIPESKEKAKKILKRIVELEPRAINAHLMLIDMAIKDEELQDARDLVIQALGSNPGNAFLLSVRSRIESQAGEKRLAAELARMAIPDLKAYCESGDGSGSVNTIVSLANLYRITGDFEDAEHWIDQAEQLDPNSTTVINEYMSLALTAYQNDDSERAKQIYRKLSRQHANKYPENIRIFNDLAWIIQESDKDYVTALDLANKGLAAAREDEEKLHLLDTRGTILFKMERFDEARSDFETLLGLSASDSHRLAKSLLQLGRICTKLNQIDKAKEHLKKALEIDQKIDVFTPEERLEIDQLK